MLDIIKKLNFFLSRKQKPAFFSLILLMVISALLEIIGIGVIPIFISVVLDYDLLNNYLTKLNISSLNFIVRINQENLLIYMSIFVLLLFLFKNLLLMLIHYFQSFFSYKLVIENSSKIYRRYLFSDFSFHASRNSATLIKNITTEVNLSVTFLSSILYLLRELIIFILICYLLLINSPLSFSFISIIFLFVLILFYQLLKKKVSELGVGQKGRVTRTHRVE